MRITNNMLINNMMRNLNNNLKKMNKIQQKLSSGKKFQLPSDDPIGVSRSLKLNTDIAKIEQYKRNLDDAMSWLEMTESAVAEVEDVLQRARELTVQAANGTNSDDDLKMISSEIEQLKDHLIKISNTTYAGRYIFSGYKTDVPLLDENGKFKLTNYEAGSGTFSSHVLSKDEVSNYNVGISDKIAINIVGVKVFGKFEGDLDNPNFDSNVNGYEIDSTNKTSNSANADKSYLIAMFDSLKTALDSGDSETIQKTLGRIDKVMENLLSITADIGAKSNRLELTKKRLESQSINFTKLLAENEEADIAEVIMNLKVNENVYRASLSAGARIIQPTLVDFLR
ncbi:flagellar hook-associated protein 3 FlgL [Caloranaerobacter azorensis DSM 13643]|uniref:Flagellar hook-associated protein 3 FlgL n=1 Tax=Caloranaerobacter azorensis DSM 13643 TaxID=1121264 RepID=A0A1M5V3Q9_9FIRM|nr:flagellar hook-associated protein FlgL [Caloranaerobacter azorensis]SHH69861.1 flagellar hook-associated protein 3 FlgL [Caloranaerobacter azorensis DSM 13643]